MIIGYCNRRINWKINHLAFLKLFPPVCKSLPGFLKKKETRKKKKGKQRIKFNSRFTSGKRETEALVIVVATKTYTSTMFPSLLFKWMEKGCHWGTQLTTNSNNYNESAMTKDFGINMRPVNKVRVSIASLKDSFFEDHVLPSIFPLNSLITSWLSETQIMLLTKNVVHS